MGNYVSCTLSGPVSKQWRKGTKVILPNGEIRHFYNSKPINAAELMLESPNHFVVNARSLKIGRRFSPLTADEDLEISAGGGVYAMFPMKRLNSAVTAADMGVLFLAAKRVSRGNVRILPNNNNNNDDDDEMLPKLNLDEIEDLSAPEFQHRMSISRSKKPTLDTIVEEPIHSR